MLVVCCADFIWLCRYIISSLIVSRFPINYSSHQRLLHSLEWKWTKKELSKMLSDIVVKRLRTGIVVGTLVFLHFTCPSCQARSEKLHAYAKNKLDELYPSDSSASHSTTQMVSGTRPTSITQKPPDWVAGVPLDMNFAQFFIEYGRSVSFVVLVLLMTGSHT